METNFEESMRRREVEEAGGGVEAEEFSFWPSFGELSIASADDEAVADGRAKPVFPLFGGDLFFDEEDLPKKPPVKKVFVEMKAGGDHDGGGSNAASGPYCDLSSRTVVEATSSSSETCKKSNSTGFSKIWRFSKDYVSRSNSDGRDAYVFLNEPHAPPPKVNKGRRTAPYSAHEVYLRNKAKEGKKKRSSSYLPYRPELMGFFTSANSGFSKNVHPY